MKLMRPFFRFQVEEYGNKEMTMVDYFKKKYNYNLKYPSLNCLHVGNPKRNTYVPMEESRKFPYMINIVI